MRGRLYTYRYCHHQNDSCVKMGSDESHFNVSLIVRDKVTKTVSTDHNFRRERRAEVDSNQPNALPLGQTGSLHLIREFASDIVTDTEEIPLGKEATLKTDYRYQNYGAAARRVAGDVDGCQRPHHGSLCDSDDLDRPLRRKRLHT